MNFNNKYKITIENEATLEKSISFRFRYLYLIAACLFFLAIAVGLAILILSSTPLKSSLPGYLKDSERAATQEQHLRLDSLINVYERNQAYLSGIINALDPPAIDSASLKDNDKTVSVSIDSLMPMSPEEKNFLDRYQKKAAEESGITTSYTTVFKNLNPSAFVSEETRNSRKAQFILPDDAKVNSIAPGNVIAVATPEGAPHTFEVIILHPGGFTSKTSNLSKVTVKSGDYVETGKNIGTASKNKSQKDFSVLLEIWDNGDAVTPYELISDKQPAN